MQIDHVAVIGAGFSGTLQAINLLRHDGPRVTLIERRDSFGRGVAYSTATPEHLLNVRASNMSALPDDPDHFVRWLAARGKGQPQSFASRCDYGDYLAELLAAELRANPGRLTLRQDKAVSLDVQPDGVTIAFADSSTLTADAAVLALGNLPPHDPAGLGDPDLPTDLYARDPWSAGVTDGLSDDDTVLIIGTGLTMIDMVLALDAKGFRGPIVALSRRGLGPQAHGDAAKTSLPEKPTELGSALVHRVRARARDIGWRSAIDELRPYTQAMWLSAPPEEQRRFLRHLRAWWDIHRHRLSPQVAEKIAALRASGRLRIVAGKLQSVDSQTGEAAFRPRHRTDIETIAARRIINCTGPQGDLLRTSEPLLKSLIASGHLRPDPLHLGIDVNAQAETIDAGGTANPRLIALGPMTRGAFWEIVAVPDIRMQTWSVARRLSHAQWVGGEGL